MSIWIKLDENRRAVSQWRMSGKDRPLAGEAGKVLMDASGLDGPFLGRVYDPLADSFTGPPYEIFISADKRELTADGADKAVVTFEARRWSGALEDVTAELPVIFDGQQIAVSVVEGRGALEIASEVPAVITIKGVRTPDFRPMFGTLILEAK